MNWLGGNRQAASGIWQLGGGLFADGSQGSFENRNPYREFMESLGKAGQEPWECRVIGMLSVYALLRWLAS